MYKTSFMYRFLYKLAEAKKYAIGKMICDDRRMP